jgi:hypothetical protein
MRALAAVRGVLMIALCASSLLAVGARAQESGNRSPPSSSLATFDDLYARVTAAAASGDLPASVATAAEELSFSLRRDLIRRDAEIEVLKLEASRFTGQRQQETLDDLIRAAATKERRLWVAIRQLERLANETAEPPGEDTEQAEAGKKTAQFRIDFEAEDVIENPDP